MCVVFLAVFPFWQENVEEGGFEIFGVLENSSRAASRCGCGILGFFLWLYRGFLDAHW